MSLHNLTVGGRMVDVTVYNLKTTGVPHGDLVDKADYDALQQRCERLEARVVWLEEGLVLWKSGWDFGDAEDEVVPWLAAEPTAGAGKKEK